MEIGKNKNTSLLKSVLKNSGFKKIVAGILLVLLFIAAFKGSAFIKTKGYSGLWDFVGTVSSNYWKGMDANPESISIEIKDKDINILEKNRQQAIERGLIINDLDGEYVPATLEYKGKKIKIKLRLKGHMTDHIETDNKWSFRIKVKGNDNFMGMKRFSIQQPGTRGYIYEWIYHELMKREDVIALRYTFINVSVNGKDWGIYAMEENFDKELIENNQRKQGPVIRLNPDQYWVKRFSDHKRDYLTSEFASYYSSNFEAYQEDKILEDTIQKNYYLKGIALAEGFRNRRLSVAQVFDIDRLAKFHAIIDLVGGQHSIDWSDIKYYYNPVSARLEPVAYESFSNFSIQGITGNYRYVSIDSNGSYEDWHTAIFSDPLFFSAYIKNLERISQTSYLDAFFTAAEKDLDANLKILYKEYPYKKFETKSYYRNQNMINKILEGSKAVHAYFKGFSSGVVSLQLGNMESLPLSIQSLAIGKNTFFCQQPTILASKKADENIEYRDVKFTIPSTFSWNDSLLSELKIQFSVLGASKIRQDQVYPFPRTDSEFIVEVLKNKKSTIADFPFLKVDEQNKRIYIQAGNHVVNSDLIVPAGYKLLANAGVSLDFKNSSKLVSYSALLFTGTEDLPVIIQSTDSSSQGIQLISAPRSGFKFVAFKNIPEINDLQWSRSGGLTFYESAVDFVSCFFYNSKAEDAVNLIRSEFTFEGCLFKNMKDDGLDVDFSEGKITNCAFEQCGENAIDLTMSKVNIKSVFVDGAGNKAFNIKAGSYVAGSDLKIENANIALSAEDHSFIDLENIKIMDTETGVVAYKNKPGAGHPEINLTNCSFSIVKTKYLKEKKSSIISNGTVIKEEVKDVEAIIKNDKKKHK